MLPTSIGMQVAVICASLLLCHLTISAYLTYLTYSWDATLDPLVSQSLSIWTTPYFGTVEALAECSTPLISSKFRGKITAPAETSGLTQCRTVTNCSYYQTMAGYSACTSATWTSSLAGPGPTLTASNGGPPIVSVFLASPNENCSVYKTDPQCNFQKYSVVSGTAGLFQDTTLQLRTKQLPTVDRYCSYQFMRYVQTPAYSIVTFRLAIACTVFSLIYLLLQPLILCQIKLNFSLRGFDHVALLFLFLLNLIVFLQINIQSSSAGALFQRCALQDLDQLQAVQVYHQLMLVRKAVAGIALGLISFILLAQFLLRLFFLRREDFEDDEVLDEGVFSEVSEIVSIDKGPAVFVPTREVTNEILNQIKLNLQGLDSSNIGFSLSHSSFRSLTMLRRVGQIAGLNRSDSRRESRLMSPERDRREREGRQFEESRDMYKRKERRHLDLEEERGRMEPVYEQPVNPREQKRKALQRKYNQDDNSQVSYQQQLP